MALTDYGIPFSGRYAPRPPGGPAALFDADAPWSILNAAGDPAGHNDPVALWVDQSGNEHHAAQATDANRPVLRVLGGFRTLEFGAAGAWLLFQGSAPYVPHSGSMDIVAAVRATGSGLRVFLNRWPTSGGHPYLFASQTGSDGCPGGFWSSASQLLSPVDIRNEWRVVTWSIRSGGVSRLRVDGIDLAAPATPSYPGSGGWRVIGWESAGRFEGHLARLAVYNRPLSATELTRAEHWAGRIPI